MCRIAAYVGPEAPLSALLFDPPHSLHEQAYRPAEMVHGTVNVDGTGVAWWTGTDPTPLSYVTTASPWADPSLQSLAGRLGGRVMLAAVRSATPGIGISSEHVHPFTSGVLAGAHNGRIAGIKGAAGRDLVAELGDREWGQLGVINDSKVLFLLVASRYDGDLLIAVEAALDVATGVIEHHGESAALNLVVSDGHTIVAARHSIGQPLDSLYVASRGDAHLIASEPLDSGAEWKPVADRHLVAVTADEMHTRPVS